MYNEVFKKLLDFGDFIGIEGELFTTQVGEKTVKVKNFTLLSKSLNHCPFQKKKTESFTMPLQIQNNVIDNAMRIWW